MDKQQQPSRLNLDKPRWDQSTYWGRCKHFFHSTDPRTVFATTEELLDAKKLVDSYRVGNEPSGTKEEELWQAKKLVDSAFHPQTGELMFFMGRMSFQVPGNMVVVGCMLTFFRTTPAVVFWQWVNQSFNALVNYTNRNASAGISTNQLAAAYCGATTASVAVAVGMNRFINNSPKLRGGFIGRLVPLAAVAAANCVNIPSMRQRELVEGIDVETEDGKVLGKSKTAAKRAVAEVLVSRIFMAIPGMTLVPAAMHKIEATPLVSRIPILAAPITVVLNGFMLVFSTPMCCALFPQYRGISFDALEPELKDNIIKEYTNKTLPTHLYYNKGL